MGVILGRDEKSTGTDWRPITPNRLGNLRLASPQSHASLRGAGPDTLAGTRGYADATLHLHTTRTDPFDSEPDHPWTSL